jgi:hypothetical protein
MTDDFSFPDAVAERSGHSVDEVLEVLTAARVPTIDRGGTPHRLRVTRLAFTGKKAGLLSGDIDFDQEFGDGLWVISTERNDAGKTSTLEIMMWCLRGQPKRLQDDVRAWIQQVRLEGLVDDDPFFVAFENHDGVPHGTLTCGTDVRPFASDAAFADTMSAFMMDQLGFESFELWVAGQGLATHRWPSYSTVLYLPREAEGAVIGDRAGDGVSQQLVQLFVGVPWARTYSVCRAALREATEGKRNAEAEIETISDIASRTVAAKETELASTRAKLLELPSDLPGDDEIAAARATWMDLIAKHSRATADLEDARTAATVAKRRARTRRKRLRDATEAALARRLFHGLNPTKCPRCSVEIGLDRREAERADHSCAVCDRELELDLDVEIEEIPIAEEDADEPQSMADLQQIVDDLEEVARSESERAAELDSEAADLARQVEEAEAAVQKHRGSTEDMQQRRTLQAQEAALEVVISELSQLTVGPQHPPQPQDEHRLGILSAAVEEAKKRRDEEFSGIVDEVNAAILDLARRFGFATLEAVKLNLAAQLRLVKGGVETSFTHQTPGEKLRLRIAVVIALLRVGHEHNVGRHPGLLLIDSIGAEETEPGNLGEFMSELARVTDELSIETIVASARPEVLSQIPPNRQIAVTGSDFLW